MGNIDWDKLGKLNVPMDFVKVLENNIKNNPTRYGYDHYSYNGIGGVPRVSEIIKVACDSNNLIEWAAKVGLKKYEMYRDDALDVGSITHKAIEEYLNGNKIDIEDIAYGLLVDDIKLINQVKTSFSNFLYWERFMKENGYTIITLASEKEILCPLFGGTIDWVVELIDTNNLSKKFIVDFKTSKSISSNYLLQTAAYRMAWNWNDYYFNGGNNFINGIGIIRLDKFTTDTLNYFFIDDYDILTRLEYDTKSMINWYYCYKDSISALKTINARSDFKNE